MPSDTPAATTAWLARRYRQMTPAAKMARVVDLNHTAEELAKARLLQQYGPLEQREIELRLAALRLDRRTMIEAFDWDPGREGY